MNERRFIDPPTESPLQSGTVADPSSGEQIAATPRPRPFRTNLRHAGSKLAGQKYLHAIEGPHIGPEAVRAATSAACHMAGLGLGCAKTPHTQGQGPSSRAAREVASLGPLFPQSRARGQPIGAGTQGAR